MKISKTHQRFSDFLNQPDSLTNPEKYLGPNWKNVLNFWIYLDTLSDDEKRKISDRYCALDYNGRDSTWFSDWDVADEVVGREFRNNAWGAAYNATGWAVFGHATVELIGSHKILDQNKSLNLLPLVFIKKTLIQKFLGFLKSALVRGSTLGN